jgi:uncharacterized pyridoxamine 5'-phosphate oxidase family protein
MNRIVEEVKKVGVFYIATIDDNKPRVRPFSSVTEFENNMYICTNNTKDVYKQIMKNNNIELSGMSKDGSWIRVSGKAIKDERKIAKEAMLNDETGPKSLYKVDDGIFEVFKIEDIKCIKYSFNSEPEVIEA